MAPVLSVGVADVLDDILSAQLLAPVYQPIVDLSSGGAVAYEALARGPSGHPLEFPGALFAAAAATGRVVELDWACRAAAIRHAPRILDTAGLSLFVNVEPASLGAPPPEHLRWVGKAAQRDRIIVEITERAIAERPAELLRAIRSLRARGFGIALDDVGADHRSLSMLPFVRPDVIKLDLSIIQRRTTSEIAQTVNTVGAEAERSGVVIIAEGIESPDHLDKALAMGASHGQGWYFGRPGPVPAALERSSRSVTLRHGVPVTHNTPYEFLSGRRTVRRGTKRVLMQMSLNLEHQALATGGAPVVLGTFQSARNFTDSTSARYCELARQGAFVGVFAERIEEVAPRPTVAVSIDGDDRLTSEWCVAIVGPHYAAAFAGQDLGLDVPDRDRQFDFVITHDRSLAIETASLLLARVNGPEH